MKTNRFLLWSFGGKKGHISKLRLKGVCQIFSVVLSKSCFAVKLEAGRAKNLWNLLQLEIASMVSITNIFLLFLLFRNFSGVDWGFPCEITASNEYCFEASLGLSVFVLLIQIFLTQGHQYFFLWQCQVIPSSSTSGLQNFVWTYSLEYVSVCPNGKESRLLVLY